jgi:hypothetical protein
MLTLWLLLAVLPFQNQETRAIPSDSVEVEARGCVKGRVFTAVATLEDDGARRGPEIGGRRFRLSGKKDVMEQVKKANGQRVELDEGIGMKVGGARVVIGAQGADPGRINQRVAAPNIPVMDVIALRSLAERCPIQ